MKTEKILLSVFLAVIWVGGCRGTRSDAGKGYKTVAPEPGRDSETAKKENAEGAHLLEKGDLEGAENKLKAAAAADILFGPAHNNLGAVYYRQQKYYLSALEFQYAAKLMPNKAEPRNNLGLVYEAVGKLDDAAKSYEEAVKLEPEPVIFAANLARAYVRLGRNDEATRRLLKEVMVTDTRPAWSAWAKERLLLMEKPGVPAAAPPAKK